MMTPTCPDWSALAKRRDLDPEGEALWEHALEHSDGCDACREAALLAEPTLLFRRMPAPEPSTADIEDMKLAVGALRRTRSLTQTSIERPTRRLPTRQRAASKSSPARRAATRYGAHLRRAAAIAAIFLAGMLLQDLTMNDASPPADFITTAEAPDERTANAVRFARELEQMPVVEDFDPSLGTMIQLEDDLVVFVAETRHAPEKLDV